MPRPAPPPEAILIRLVREAAGLKLPAVAKAAGISVARWSQVADGYETRLGQRKPVTGSRATVAHMASAVGLSPERRPAEGKRPDAAAVLREIQRSDHDGYEPRPVDPEDYPPGPLPGHRLHRGPERPGGAAIAIVEHGTAANGSARSASQA